MKSILLASAISLLVIGSAAAQPLDIAPSAQLRYEMKFGGADPNANVRALRFAAGVMRPASDDAATMGDRIEKSATTAPLMTLLDTGYSFGSQKSDLHLVGFDLLHRDRNPALDAAREHGWWANNWGWVVIGGIAAVTIIAVTAIHEGTKDDNRYSGGPTPDPNNQCSGPVFSSNVGGTCHHVP